MSEVATASGFTREVLAELIRRGGDGGLTSLRRDAFRRFEAMPVPSQATEEWRYTDLSRLDFSAYLPHAEEPEAANLDGVSADAVAATGEIGDRAGLAIQHNSTVVTAHLDPELVGRGVAFASLDRGGSLVERTLHHAIPADRTKFTALHAAFRAGGTFVHVPAGVEIELPLQTVTYVDRDGLAVFPHTLIVAEEGAAVTVIDRYRSPDLEQVLSDAVVEIHAGPGARVRYVSLQEWGSGVTHLSVQRAVLGADATLNSLAVAFGASLSRTEVESVLQGPGATSEMLGLYFAEADQHFDLRSLQDHAAPNGTSDLLSKGVLTDRARAVYSGWVHIRPGARRSDAFQTNRNIVLSDQAKADSIPNLEIENNDVRCGHAASVGPVDLDTMFYIQSRGISEAEAQKLVVNGFFQEVLDRVTLPEVRSGLEAAIAEELERA
jgi:Fe-S cluster assembly protein SufD